LIWLGHQNIAYLTTPLNRRSRKEQLEGCRLALLRQDLHLSDQNLLVAGQEEENESALYEIMAGRQLAEQFLALPERPSAIIAVNDLLAMSIIQVLLAAGLHIPEDVSVVGFDDLVFASVSTPTLTTIRQPAQEIGQLATNILLGHLHDNATLKDITGQRRQPVSITLEPTLVIRQSTTRRIDRKKQ
jgi:LacI family transcriptional regulator